MVNYCITIDAFSQSRTGLSCLDAARRHRSYRSSRLEADSDRTGVDGRTWLKGDGPDPVTTSQRPWDKLDPDDADTLPALLLAMAAGVHPDVEAVVEGDLRVTYAELAEQARRGAAALIAAGHRGGRRRLHLGAQLDRLDRRHARGGLGRRRSGSPQHPLPGPRSRLHPQPQPGQAAAHGGPVPRAGTIRPSWPARTCRTCRRGSSSRAPTWDDFLARGDSGAALAAADRRAALVEPDDWLDLMFTSGTTGKPKGVRSTHRATIRSYRYFTRNLDIRLGDRYLLVNPLFHSFGSKAGVVASLTVGATVFPVPVFDPSGAADLIAKEQITVFPGPPTIYHALLQLPEEKRAELKSLRLGVTGAAAVPVELLRRMSSELGFDVVLTAYGLTETAGLVTMCRAGDPMEVVSATSGRAIPGVEVATVDPSGQPTPPGEPGEVVVRGYPVIDRLLRGPRRHRGGDRLRRLAPHR